VTITTSDIVNINVVIIRVNIIIDNNCIDILAITESIILSQLLVVKGCRFDFIRIFLARLRLNSRTCRVDVKVRLIISVIDKQGLVIGVKREYFLITKRVNKGD
jgi:hypothetical protein